ncbi:MAG TPA: hypothetical protein VMU94_24070 [Streptosporangiaceae bacterium]|nr:hypothetical protein [Streptosporangiaceae bacterium]
MSETAGSALIQRMRMARRVADVLVPQEGNVIITAVSTGDVLTGQSDGSPLEADFVMTALDLMLQLSLLVGRDRDALNDSDVLATANALLWANPQSAACVLIADDDLLTSRIVEWGDRAVDTPHSAIISLIPRQGPLRDTVMRYLSTIDLPWPEPSTLMTSHGLAFDQVASHAAISALSERHAGRKSPIPERAQARASLTVADAEWATRLALTVANSEHVDIDAELEAGGRR